jgi:uncharacterized protein (DUF427 family)
MQLFDKQGHVVPITKRVRAFFAGHVIVDAYEPRLVWEHPHYPAYYFPIGDVVRADVLRPSNHRSAATVFGEATYFDVIVGERIAKNAAWRYLNAEKKELRELVRFDWNAMEGWFEEDEEVFVHPRDPWHRIDILHSSRHVEVFCEGTKLADTRRPTLLFETSLPCRHYLPKTDVRMDLLTPSDRTTGCAHKGFARYWSFGRGEQQQHADIAWSYSSPFAEALKIAGLVCFYAERLDIRVDGVALPRPETPFYNKDAGMNHNA